MFRLVKKKLEALLKHALQKHFWKYLVAYLVKSTQALDDTA